MQDTPTDTEAPIDTAALRAQLLDAAMIHVPFDGWSEATFRAAIAETGVAPALARAACPRGAIDLAAEYHRRADRVMQQRLADTDMSALRMRDKIAAAIRFRFEAVDDKEAVRRAVSLFALPPYAADGARLVWETVDAIWTGLGDRSDDINWYTKRASLAAVYSATLLYWLGDDSHDGAPTWAFLGRRIEGVMQVERVKASIRGNRALKPFLAGPDWLARQIRPPHARRARGAPDAAGSRGLPGSLGRMRPSR